MLHRKIDRAIYGQDEQGNYVRTQYYHLDTRKVLVGEYLLRGQQLGTLGSSGLLAAYLPHLHFEVLTSKVKNASNYLTIDPHFYWVEGPGRVTCFRNDRVWVKKPFKITYPVPCKDSPWN